MTEDHQARLQAALDEIAQSLPDDLAGERVRCGCYESLRTFTARTWRWSWAIGSDLEACGYEATPNKAIAAACRTLRAALGVPEPVTRAQVEAWLAQRVDEHELETWWQPRLDMLESDDE